MQDMRNRAKFKKYARLYLCLALQNLAITVRPSKGIEKYIKDNRDLKKRGGGTANFCYLKEKRVDISYKQKQLLPTK